MEGIIVFPSLLSLRCHPTSSSSPQLLNKLYLSSFRGCFFTLHAHPPLNFLHNLLAIDSQTSWKQGCTYAWSPFLPSILFVTFLFSYCLHYQKNVSLKGPLNSSLIFISFAFLDLLKHLTTVTTLSNLTDSILCWFFPNSIGYIYKTTLSY